MTERSTRRLAAIMFTDMVGYTALMQQDEELAIQKRQRHRSVLVDLHEKFEGEIIQYFGDGTLSIFTNSLDAVQCAIAIQQTLQKAPIEVPLRIGIHSGSILLQEDGIIGDAVNLASRIESFANVGGVLISDVVHEQVCNQAQLDFLSMGKFSLKNVERPFEIYAVVAEGLALADPHSIQGKGQRLSQVKTNIPHPEHPLLGREEELQAALDLIQAHRLTTITGSGGIGKTRFTLELLHVLAPKYQHGAGFISLAALSEVEEVMPYIAASLDIKDVENMKPIERVAALVGTKHLLLAIDNFEHVIEASDEIRELLELCPNLSLICTSRTPLKLQKEKEFALSPLSLPQAQDLSDLHKSPAVQLFVDRAQQANQGFSLTKENSNAIVQICQRMDGIPLALELAAARVRMLSPEKLLRRLSRALDLLTTGSNDLPERHRTLRATIDWSHSFLSEEEKILFRRLAVFAGGFTLDAIESVCYENEDDALQAIDDLESLVDKSLVQAGSDGRFGLLQTIKDFASERFTSAGEQDLIRDRHAKYFFEIALEIEKGAAGFEQAQRMRQGAAEELNCQAALDHLLSGTYSGDIEARETGFLMCGALWMYWHIRGKHSFAKEYTTNFLEALEDATPSLGRSQALFSAHVAYFSLGEQQKSLALANEQLKVAQSIKNDLEIAKSHICLTFGHLNSDFAKAQEASIKGVELCRPLDKPYWLGMMLWQNGLVSLISGDIEKAKKSYSEAYAIFINCGDREGIGLAVAGLALLAGLGGDHEKSIALYHEAIESFQQVGDRPEEARALSEISWGYLAQRNTVAARKYIFESIQAHLEMSSMRGVGHALTGLAALAAIEGDAAYSVVLAAAAHHFAEQEGVLMGFLEEDKSAPYIAKAKESLSPEQIEDAQRKGIALSLDQILTADQAVLAA